MLITFSGLLSKWWNWHFEPGHLSQVVRPLTTKPSRLSSHHLPYVSNRDVGFFFSLYSPLFHPLVPQTLYSWRKFPMNLAYWKHVSNPPTCPQMRHTIAAWSSPIAKQPCLLSCPNPTPSARIPSLAHHLLPPSWEAPLPGPGLALPCLPGQTQK